MPFLGGKNSEVALFDTLLSKATSHLNLETEWGAILNICDLIRQQDVSAKYAVAAIKKKLSSDNPHSVLYALQTLESMVKNCGSLIIEEVFGTREFLEYFKDLVYKPDPIKSKVLELVQIWGTAFGSRYRSIEDTYKTLKNEGMTFPALKAADAMFESEVAPEWKEGSACHRCRAGFTTFRRRHHCRSCGNSFCNECSSKQSLVPRYGIEKEVRVCDTCYDEITKPSADSPVSGSNETSTAQSDNNRAAREKERELELKEKEELELALAISASEAEIKDKARQRTPNNGLSSSSNTAAKSRAPESSAPALYSNFDSSDLDPELARYLNRNYWEKKNEEQQRQQQPVAIKTTLNPSAPVAYSPDVVQTTATNGAENGLGASLGPSQEEKDKQREEFISALTSSIEIFVNRMRSNTVRGRSIAADSTVQTLFMTLNAMHPQLIHHMHDTEQRRNEFEELQDKLAQLRDAREALNALREEHEARRRAEQEERERQRYAQMMQKLEVMRNKKHEYMEYQRQLALQRMQEQEREYQARMEAQKQRLAMEQYRKQFPYSSGAYQQHPNFQPIQQPQAPNEQQPPPQGPYPPYQPGPQGFGYPPGAPYQMPPPPPYTYHPSDPYHMHSIPPGQQPQGFPSGAPSPQHQPPQNYPQQPPNQDPNSHNPQQGYQVQFPPHQQGPFPSQGPPNSGQTVPGQVYQPPHPQGFQPGPQPGAPPAEEEAQLIQF